MPMAGAAKATLPENPNRLVVMGMTGWHSVSAGLGQPEPLPHRPCSVPGNFLQEFWEASRVQMFPVPEPNVSGLRCWFCHLLPWKSDLRTLT